MFVLPLKFLAHLFVPCNIFIVLLVICLRRIRALHYIGCRAYSFARFLLRAETVPSPELPTIQFPTEHSDNTLPSSPSQTDDLPLSECQDAAATTTPEGSLVQKTKKWDNVLIYLSMHSFPSSLTIPNDYYHFIGLSPCDQRKAGIALEREREREKKKKKRKEREERGSCMVMCGVVCCRTVLCCIDLDAMWEFGNSPYFFRRRTENTIGSYVTSYISKASPNVLFLGTK